VRGTSAIRWHRVCPCAHQSVQERAEYAAASFRHSDIQQVVYPRAGGQTTYSTRTETASGRSAMPLGGKGGAGRWTCGAWLLARLQSQAMQDSLVKYLTTEKQCRLSKG